MTLALTLAVLDIGFSLYAFLDRALFTSLYSFHYLCETVLTNYATCSGTCIYFCVNIAERQVFCYN